MTDQLLWQHLGASVYTNSEIKHLTYTSDFQTLVWDMQTLSEGLPEKTTTVFSYLSKFVTMYVVFLYFGFSFLLFIFLSLH
jgi:hypothetical protein